MRYYIQHNGQQLGPYSLDEVRAHLNAGAIQSTDLAWQEGTPDWKPLSSMLGLATGVPPPLVPPPGLSSPPQTSGLAIASLVLGIVSFFTLGLGGIAAIICGHLASSRIKASNGRLTGRGLATAGLITGYFGFLFIFLGVLAGIALPVFNSVQVRGKAVKSLAQAKSIALCCKLYADDHGGDYPETLDQLVPTYLTDRRLLFDPLSLDRTAADYQYYGGKSSDPDSQLLLENKDHAVRHLHVSVHMDGSGEIKRE